MKFVETSCRNLVIQAQKEGMSISALIALIQNEWQENVADKTSTSNREENNMTKAERELEERLLNLNEEMERLTSEIEEKYGEEKETLKKRTSEEILLAEEESEKMKIINRFYSAMRKIEAKEIQEKNNLRARIMNEIIRK